MTRIYMGPSQPRGAPWLLDRRFCYVALCRLQCTATTSDWPIHSLILSFHDLCGLPLRRHSTVPCSVFGKESCWQTLDGWHPTRTFTSCHICCTHEISIMCLFSRSINWTLKSHSEIYKSDTPPRGWEKLKVVPESTMSLCWLTDQSLICDLIEAMESAFSSENADPANYNNRKRNEITSETVTFEQMKHSSGFINGLI